MNIEIEREIDGRWIAEVPDLPGVMTYGTSREEAIAKVEALAFRVLADRLGAYGTGRATV
jgi:predicted RNase H-like HicB family nuclease